MSRSVAVSLCLAALILPGCQQSNSAPAPSGDQQSSDTTAPSAPTMQELPTRPLELNRPRDEEQSLRFPDLVVHWRGDSPGGAEVVLNGLVVGRGYAGFYQAAEQVEKMPVRGKLFFWHEGPLTLGLGNESGDTPDPFSAWRDLDGQVSKAVDEKEVYITAMTSFLCEDDKAREKRVQRNRELGPRPGSLDVPTEKDAPFTIPQVHNPAHKSRICGLALSPSGAMIATGSADGRLIIWPMTGRPRTLDCRADEVWSLAFSPNERQLAVGADGFVAVVDAASMEVVWRKDENALYRQVAFSDSGESIAVVTHVSTKNGSVGKPVEVLDAGSGVLRQLLFCDDRHLDHVSFLNNDGQVIACGRDGVYLWDTASGKLLKKISHNVLDGFAVSPNAEVVAVGDVRDSVSVLDLRDGRRVHRLNLSNTGACGASMQFSPDGRLLATGIRGVLLWDATTGMPLKSLTWERTYNLCFSADGKTLVSSQNDGRVMRWDISDVVTTAGSPETHRLDRRNVAVQQGEDAFGQPCGLFAIGAKAGNAAGDLAAVYRAALAHTIPQGSVALIGFSSNAGQGRFRLPHMTETEVLDYTRQGNDILVRVKCINNSETLRDSGFCYVKVKLPVLEPGRYRAAIQFDEYKDGQYVKPATNMVFTESHVEDEKGHAAKMP